MLKPTLREPLPEALVNAINVFLPTITEDGWYGKVNLTISVQDGVINDIIIERYKRDKVSGRKPQKGGKKK